jgi:hypothetical protein
MGAEWERRCIRGLQRGPGDDASNGLSGRLGDSRQDAGVGVRGDGQGAVAELLRNHLERHTCLERETRGRVT